MQNGCEEIRELLGRYLTGHLDAGLRRKVEDHLTTCKACGRELPFLASLAQAAHERELRGEGYHLESGLLVELAVNPGVLDPFIRNAAIQHIRRCDRCKEEYELAGGVAGDLGLRAGGEPVSKREYGYLRQLGRWLTRPLAPAWLVTAVVALILIAIFGGRLRRDVETPEEPVLAAGHDLDTTVTQVALADIPRGGAWLWRPAEGQAEPPARSEEDAALIGKPVPRVFVLGEGTILNSDSEVWSVVSRPPVELSPEAPGDSLYLVFERPEGLIGVPTAFVSLLGIADSSVTDQMLLGELRLPTGSGPVLVPIPGGILHDGAYVLLIQPPIEDPAKAVPRKTAFHLAVNIGTNEGR